MILVRLGLTLLLWGCALSRAAEPVREWTFFFYSGSDEGSKEIKSPFNRSAVAVIKSLEAIESLRANDDKVALLLQYDASGDDLKEDTHNREWRRKLQYVPPDQTTYDRIDSPGLTENEIRKFDPQFKYHEQDTGNPVTLKKFIQWGVKAYPAKHYALVLLGHSWGQQGLLQDAHVNGKDLTQFSLLRNYEIRRAMQEVYREEKIGKFDLLLIDACTSGQLDVLLELKEVFTYFVGSSMETPFVGVPYTQLLGRFFTQLENHDGELNAGFIETELLRPLVTDFVESHVAGGFLAQAEGQTDAVQAFAVKMDRLPYVANALTKFVRALPAEARKWFHERELDSLWVLSDPDENADLLQIARNLLPELRKKGTGANKKQWEVAAKATEELIASLGYRAANPSVEPTAIQHPAAIGAWAHVEIDPLIPNRDTAVCIALRTLTMLNGDKPELLPTTPIEEPTNKPVPLLPLMCNERERDLKKKNLLQVPVTEFGKPIAIEKMLRLNFKWKQGIPGYVTEFAGKDDTLEKRILSVWVPKPATGPLQTSLRLKFATNATIDLDYLSQSPEGFVKKEPGFEKWLLQHDRFDVSPAIYVTDPKDLEISPGVPGPYLAEAHTNGTQFKHGFGLFLGTDLSVATYNYGRMPLERVETVLNLEPFSLTLEKYEQDFAAIAKELEKAGLNVNATGLGFYRQNRIAETGWPDLLFGRAAHDDTDPFQHSTR